MSLQCLIDTIAIGSCQEQGIASFLIGRDIRTVQRDYRMQGLHGPWFQSMPELLGAARKYRFGLG